VNLVKATHFRRSGRQIVPYLSIPIDDREAVTGLIRGPHFAGTDSRGVYHLMISHDFILGGTIHDSKIPLRR
jgi:hypothetical protein